MPRCALAPRVRAVRSTPWSLSADLRITLYLATPLEPTAAPEELLKPKNVALVNRVVQIDGEDAYEAWYCLTSVPDLQWCHVAPLERRGAYDAKPGPSGHVAEGRARRRGWGLWGRRASGDPRRRRACAAFANPLV